MSKQVRIVGADGSSWSMAVLVENRWVFRCRRKVSKDGAVLYQQQQQRRGRQ